MGKKLQRIVTEIISALLILLFVYAALSKLLDFQKFRVEVGRSPLLNPYADFVSFGIPILEIFIAGLLSLKKTQFIGLYMAFSMMVMFSSYIILILKFSPFIPCSCGGILQNMSWNQHLIFNVAFAIACSISILIYPNNN